MIIGILEADPALEPLRDEFGNYVSMFKDLLKTDENDEYEVEPLGPEYNFGEVY